MRIGPQLATRRNAVTRFRPLRGPAGPSRAFFIQRSRSPEELQALRDALETHFPLAIPTSFRRKPYPNPGARNIAVIGGGITGLTTAFYISRQIPAAKITIFDKRPRLGGWLESERLQVGDGDVLFEWGPRSLRPDRSGSGAYTIDLLSKLFDNGVPLIAVSKDAPASRNRFIYYASKLVAMPGMRGSWLGTVIDTCHKLLVEPIFNGLFRQLLSAELNPCSRAASVRDESVGQFMRRNFGPTVTNNLVSAIFHGIYAGNINNLSVRTLLPRLWYLDTRDTDTEDGLVMKSVKLFGTSFVDYRQLRGRTLLTGTRDSKIDDAPAFQVLERDHQLDTALANCSMYTFPNGLQHLSDSLVSSFSNNSNVTISTSTQVDRLDYDPDRQIINLATSPVDPSSPSPNSEASPQAFDHVVSTVSPTALSTMLKTSLASSRIPERAQQALDRVSHAVNVMVVNLYYPAPNLLPSSLEGFGYLIPASVGIDENPERALGVIFSSNSSGIRGPDAIRRTPRQTAAELQSLRESMEQSYQTDPGRLTRIQAIERFEKLTRDDPDHDKDRDGSDLDDAGFSFIDIQKSDLAMYEMGLHHQIDAIKKQEEEARVREAQPSFDPTNNFDETRIGQDTATGTKLTVMLGGHWWDTWEDSDLPTEAEGITRAKSLLARHLHITDEPEVAKARLQRNCIPQYPVGYRDFMATLHKDVLAPTTGKFDGRLKVAGAWWQGGVGVSDCIRKAFETVVALREGWDDCTGLEEYVGNEKWFLVRRSEHGGRVLEPDMKSIDR
ncbi:hypothetical protein DV737_g5480, partial [Chaetothyriales sp. CBS 132003]